MAFGRTKNWLSGIISQVSGGVKPALSGGYGNNYVANGNIVRSQQPALRMSSTSPAKPAEQQSAPKSEHKSISLGLLSGNWLDVLTGVKKDTGAEQVENEQLNKIQGEWGIAPHAVHNAIGNDRTELFVDLLNHHTEGNSKRADFILVKDAKEMTYGSAHFVALTVEGDRALYQNPYGSAPNQYIVDALTVAGITKITHTTDEHQDSSDKINCGRIVPLLLDRVKDKSIKYLVSNGEAAKLDEPGEFSSDKAAKIERDEQIASDENTAKLLALAFYNDFNESNGITTSENHSMLGQKIAAQSGYWTNMVTSSRAPVTENYWTDLVTSRGSGINR